MGRILGAAVVLVCCTGPVRGGPGAEPLSPAGSIPLAQVEGRMDHMAFDPSSQRLFISALENHSIEIVDLAKRERIRSVPGIMEPQGMVLAAKSRRLIVCSRGDGTVRSFDSGTMEPGPWLDLGVNADSVRIDESTRTVFVGSGGEDGDPGALTAVDLAAFIPAAGGGKPPERHSPADLLADRPGRARMKARARLTSKPETMQIDPSGRRVYVNLPDDHAIAVVGVTDAGFGEPLAWPVEGVEKNFSIAVDPEFPRLFIAGRKPARLLEYDTGTGKLRSSVECVGDVDELFYDARTRRVYAVGGEGFVDVFHCAPGAAGGPVRIGHVPTVPRARTGCYAPDLHLLVVAAPHDGDRPAQLLLFHAGD
jgi:hypothetical protein